MRIAFIGGGVMGEAMIGGMLAKGVTASNAITVSDIDPGRCKALRDKYGIVTASNSKAVQGAEVVLLAIKPQALAEVMEELKGKLEPWQLVLSIVAGARIESLREGLGYEGGIIRAMPNTPAQIGEGMIVWTGSLLRENQQQAGKSILGALGREICVSDEKYIDMATAVSGSGPAYIFLIIESLVDAAVHIGISREIAKELVTETILGSVRLAQKSGKHPAELRNMVTSPGGTTAAGLQQLEEAGLRGILAKAVIAAYDKAKLLGGLQ